MNLTSLRNIGFSDGEVKVYEALLLLGTTNLHAIAERVPVDRRNIYDILNKLIEKGLVSYTVERGKKTFQVTHPHRIINYIEEKRKFLDEQEREMRESLPSLLRVFNERKEEIRAEIYRGSDAMKALLTEALEHKEIYFLGGNTWGNYSVPEEFQRWFKHWMDERVRRKVMMYDLVDSGTFLPGLLPDDLATHKKNYYKHCELPEHLSSPLVIAIYGDSVAQILWSKQSFAFVLESGKIKKSFMKYFHLFWNDPW